MFRFQPPLISAEILSLIASIDEFKGAWRASGTISPERLDALKRVATIESIGSSTRIESSKLSDREVEKLMAGLSSTSFESRDEQEVAGYTKVMELVFTSWEYIAFNENHIQQLHRDLLSYVNKDTAHRGKYKTHENNVVARDADGKVIELCLKQQRLLRPPRLMVDLVAWYRAEAESKTLHPLLAISVLQVKRLEKKVEHEKIVLAVMPELSLRILDLTRERGRITLAWAVELTGANRSTAKQHLQKLLDAGHLTRHGAGRGSWYGLS